MIQRKYCEYNQLLTPDLQYDEVRIDSMGNLLGRIGNGPKTILFDSHVDTVVCKG